jgi:hypothetical protein
MLSRRELLPVGLAGAVVASMFCAKIFDEQAMQQMFRKASTQTEKHARPPIFVPPADYQSCESDLQFAVADLLHIVNSIKQIDNYPTNKNVADALKDISTALKNNDYVISVPPEKEDSLRFAFREIMQFVTEDCRNAARTKLVNLPHELASPISFRPTARFVPLQTIAAKL